MKSKYPKGKKLDINVNNDNNIISNNINGNIKPKFRLKVEDIKDIIKKINPKSGGGNL